MKYEDIQTAYKELVNLKNLWKERGFEMPEIMTILGIMITNVAIANSIPLAEFQGVMLSFFTRLYTTQVDNLTEELKKEMENSIPT